jgi:glycosyltransferase involved in cell wall biosynthesis
MTRLHVSCIVTAYNSERWLADAIDSVLAQTYPDRDVVVVDDGSDDATLEVARNFGPAVRIVETANLGTAEARNAGLANSAGDLVAFLDADDRWRPGKVARQVERFEERADLAICTGMVETFWDGDVSEEERRARDRGKELAGWTWSAMAIRREVFDRIGTLAPYQRHADDTEWLLRVRAEGLTAELLPEVLADRRLHEDNLSWRQRAESLDEYLDLLLASVRERRMR